MANKGPETTRGKIWKDSTGDGRKPPTVENILGLETNKKKRTKRKKRTK